MDDPRWLKLITIGLVLAALATGYFILSGRLASNKAPKPGTEVSQTTPPIASMSASPSPSVLGQSNQTSPAPTPISAYSAIANRTQQGTQTLPATGFPAGLVVVLTISTMLAGWGLRRFPK